MAGFLIITEEGASLGFRCAGIECLEVNGLADIPALLFKLQAGGRYGLVVVDEKILERVPEHEMRRIHKKGLPIIMPINIPRQWGEAEFGESPVVRLIRRAIGYQIKIKK
jgi:vacuolar-type H+-ATPase subunit F/Vma7